MSTRSGFEVRVQEWDYLDGQHATEQVNYIVVESGSHELPGGARVEAGRFNANAVSSFASIEFSQAFNSVPVVMTTINSVNEGDAVAMRLKNITTTGFDYRIQEQESNDKQHASRNSRLHRLGTERGQYGRLYVRDWQNVELGYAPISVFAF